MAQQELDSKRTGALYPRPEGRGFTARGDNHRPSTVVVLPASRARARCAFATRKPCAPTFWWKGLQETFNRDVLAVSGDLIERSANAWAAAP